MHAIANLNITEADRLVYFEQIQQSFQNAVKAVGEVQYFYKIANYSICLRFAGSALFPYVIPALAHLKISPVTNPDLTICLWNNTSNSRGLTQSFNNLADLIKVYFADSLGIDVSSPKNIKSYDTGEYIVSSFDFEFGMVSTLNLQQNLAFCSFTDIHDIPYWHKCSPLQFIFNLWMDERHHQYVHAGAIGYRDGGVLLVGKGGSGKSSTSLTCLDSPLLYAGDDYCLAVSEPQPYVYSLYNSAKLKGVADLERFPHLASLIENRDRLDTEKAILFLHQHYPEQVVQGFPIKAILVPKVTGSIDTFYRPISGAIALRALAPSTMFQLHSNKQRALQSMSNLVKQVPCYILELGTDMRQIPVVISTILGK